MSRTWLFVIAAVTGIALTVPAGAAAGSSSGETVASDAIVGGLIPITGDGGPRSIDLGVRFEINSARLTKAARRQLYELGKALTSPRLAKAKFQINGHTDASGAAAYNKALSAKRARAVKSYLVERFGVDPRRLAAHGWGEERLKDSLNPNDPVNRRVEIVNVSPPAAGPAAQPGGATKPDGGMQAIQ